MDEVPLNIGFHLGDRESHICELDEGGQIIEEGTVATMPPARRRQVLQRCERTRIATEAGGPSGWMNDLLTGNGHDVIVANPRKRP